jgi:glucose-6-phosphate isomerase
MNSASIGYRQSIDGCTDRVIGAHGLSSDELGRMVKRCEPLLAQLTRERQTGSLPLLSVPADRDDLDRAATALKSLSHGAELIVFYGTGGSGLGGQTLAQTGGWNIPTGGKGADKAAGRPRVRFFDNLDPATLAQALASFDFATTRFVVTSKSGNTAETLIQAITTIQAAKAKGFGDRLAQIFLGITEPDKPGSRNGLRSLFAHHGIPMLDHHLGVGGRFSSITNVGLLPAMAMGLDPVKIRQGAAAVLDQLDAASNPADVPAALGAAVAVGLNELKGIRIQVMMPYCDRLGRFAAWFVQLWGESLGKNGLGTTPVGAQGPVDQHSQLQLYMDGPRDHLISIVRLPAQAQGPVLDADLAKLAGLDWLAGKGPGDLTGAQSLAIAEALGTVGRPVRLFDVDEPKEHVIGALLMHFMLETIIAGRLMGVDPFDQPGVELGKVLAKKRLV